MRRSGQFRLCATLLALWVPMVAGETGLVPHCSEHHASGQTTQAASAGHHSHSPAPKQHEHGVPDGTSSSCTCIDAGTTSRGVAVFDVPQRIELEPSVVSQQVVLPPPAPLPVPLTLREFVQYATGPPVSLA